MDCFAGGARRDRHGDAGRVPTSVLGNLQRFALAVIVCATSHTAHGQVVSPRQLVEVVDISSPVISPDGSHVAFRVELASIERNTYETVWYVQEMKGDAPPRRVSEGGVPLRESWGLPSPSPVTWSQDGRWIYFLALLDGRVDVWRASVDGSVSAPVTHAPADVREFSITVDGRFLDYSVGPTRHEVDLAEWSEYFSGIRIDKSVPIGQGLFRSGFVDGRLSTQRLRDSEVIRHPLLAGSPDVWWRLDLRTGKSALRAEEAAPQPRSAGLAAGLPSPWKIAPEPAGGRVALLTRVGELAGRRVRPDVELAVLSGRSARSAKKCTDELCTKHAITGLQWRPGTAEVVFTVTDPDSSQSQSILRWNVETGAVQRVAGSRGLLNGGRDSHSQCGISAAALACVAAAADRPPRLIRIDLDSGVQRTMFDPNEVLARDMERVSVRQLSWKDALGRSFNGIYYPATREDGKPSPLFITYYRCSGFVRGGVGDEWPLATLAGAGVSALCINAAPTRADAIERYDLGLSAVESAVDLLVRRGEVDRTRVGMGGLSFGSEVTLWTAIHSDVLAAASVSSPPMSPLVYLFLSMHGERFTSRLEDVWQLGSPEGRVERWKRISPSFNLDKIDIPILMQLPEQEYLHAMDLATPLILEHRADLYVYPNEPHQKFQPKHKLAVYHRNLDWFRFWLQDVEGGGVARAIEYGHWRTMRDRLANRRVVPGEDGD